MSKPLGIGAAVIVVILAWMFRFDVNTTSKGSAWVLDRWTGGVTSCYGRKCVDAASTPLYSELHTSYH